MTAELQTLKDKTWPDYRAVWRWHFYASLFCIPFVVVLSITGAVYLFKSEYESWQERPFDRLEFSGSGSTASAQILAALAAEPDASLVGYEIPQSRESAARVLVRRDGKPTRVYVHPGTLEVLAAVPEGERLMPLVKRIHGELLVGENGSILVELAASWTILMILTGLFLWWPRHLRGLGGVLYPRLHGGRRMFWRDLHSVAGVWISSLTLFLLVSGLPWSKLWGDYFRTVRRITGTAGARQDWSNRGEPGERSSGNSGEHAGHDHDSKRPRRSASVPKDLSAVDRIVAAVAPMDLPPPVVVAPPMRGAGLWSVKSMTPNRPLRVNLTVDGETGEVVASEGFHDRPMLDRLVAIGIAAHEGRLFGWPNQVLGLLTAAGLNLLCISGLVLWLRRRREGELGAPKAAARPRASLGLVAMIAALGIYLPLFGGSLIAVLLLETLVLSRIEPVRAWLGLQPPRSRAIA